ncbi:MAG: hypothetical protein JO279_15405 [Verrucomicrobia bacterium]|nr:hypothetical protein [Verrucomicrobiota bacterium]
MEYVDRLVGWFTPVLSCFYRATCGAGDWRWHVSRTDRTWKQRRVAPWRTFRAPGAAPAAVALFGGMLMLLAFSVMKRNEPLVLSSRFFMVEDHGQLIGVGHDGTLSGPVSWAKAEQGDSVRRVLAAALSERPLPMSSDLQPLRSGSETSLGHAAGGSSLAILGPAQTLVPDAHPEFRWPAVPGASGYVLHINEAKGNQEVYRSGIIGTQDDASGPIHWRLRDQERLTAGVIYCWHATAMAEGQPLNVPGAGDQKTKFAVIVPAEASALEKAKRSWNSSALAGAILDFNAGLLDEAEAGFRKMRDDASQTPQGRVLLDRLITSVQQSRRDQPE